MNKVIGKYKTFISYIFVAILSFLIDIILFNIFLYIFKGNIHRIFISTIIARIISSFINYLLNKNKVFNNNKDIKTTIYKYYILVIIQMVLSATLVSIIYKLISINENLIKIPVDIILFICNYFIQKLIIFKRK